MNKKITLYTLNGCGFCEELKKMLTTASISYNAIECGDKNKYCDELEAIASCDSYPMAIIEKNPFERVIICLSNNYENLKEIKKIDRKTILVNVHSILNMLDVIKNI